MSTSAGSVPFVSVVVPTYRRPEAVQACVDALRRLDHPADRLEIVVVDDGSPEPVAVASAAAGPPVRVLRQENQGPATARNRGAAAARGEILAFTDDDCRPRPDWIRHLVRALEERPTALVGGVTVNALADDPWAEASQELVSFLYEAFDDARRLRPFFTSNNIAATRDAYAAVGGFDETFPSSAAEDRDLGERWEAHGPLVLVPEARVDHHHHMDLRRFVRQHFGYGRGAWHLARRRALRGEAMPLPEPPRFYLRMLAFPVRRKGWVGGLPLAARLALSQAATAAGIAVEGARRGRRALDAPPTDR